jgi:hypothetical protein
MMRALRRAGDSGDGRAVRLEQLPMSFGGIGDFVDLWEEKSHKTSSDIKDAEKPNQGQC